MTGQVIELIERRIKLRNRDYNLYKHVKNGITRECCLAKECWLNQNKQEIQRDLLVYNKVKNYNINPRHPEIYLTKDKDSKILFKNEKMIEK